jgi:CheY-like chemotaxis protein
LLRPGTKDHINEKLVTNKNQCFLIDDDLDDQEIFLMALEQIDAGLSCICANNAVEALASLTGDTSFKPGYIFIDINMPKVNGIRCLAEIRALEHLEDAVITMSSTFADNKIMEECKALGADRFLVKPTSLPDLVKSLSKILER